MPALYTENQKKSLFNLLANEEGKTLSLLKQQLVEKGEGAVPEFEMWLKEVHGSPAEQHMVEVLGQLKYGQCHRAFLDFCKKAWESEDFDLEDGAFLLAATEYPATDFSPYRTKLDEMTSEIRLQHARTDQGDMMAAMCHVLHNQMGFRGNRENYFEADNSYIHRVLDRKVGIPLSLSLLYIILGKRLDWPVCGIALPGHFLVGFGERYYDPFNFGRRMSDKDCEELVKSYKHTFREEYLFPATSIQVMGRMLRNLVRVYQRVEDQARATRIANYLAALNEES